MVQFEIFGSICKIEPAQGGYGKLTHPFIVRLILRQAQDAVPFMVSLSNHHDEVPSF